MPEELKPLDRQKFAATLEKYRKASAETRRLSIAAGEAEQAKERAYAAECKLREKAIEMWKASRSLNEQYMELFRMPTGETVRIEKNLIWFEEVTAL